MGYCVAPEELMAEIWKVMEVNVFCVHHPTQRAFAEYLKTLNITWIWENFIRRKEIDFCHLIKDTDFKITPSKGTYFQLLDYSK